MPYYEIMDNLIADHRAKEAQRYLEIYQTLPAHKPFLVPVYQAYIAIAEYDIARADTIMADALKKFENESGFLFEYAQYHARKCDYEKALEFYEKNWSSENQAKPRFTDALEGIATIYEILGDRDMAISTYDRIITCVKEEWGYRDEDAVVIDVERKKKRLMDK